jgi:hypothetical protein
MTDRTCRTCAVDQPVDCFWRQPSRKDGLQTECKTCMRVRTANYHRNNRSALRPKNNAVITARRRADPIRALLSSVRARAKAAGLEFNLTADDIVLPARCPVLGIELSFGIGQGLGASLAQRDTRYSIDRIDNSRGYTPDNIVVVSYRANRIKSDAKLGELLAVARFYERLETEKAGQADLPTMFTPSEKEERSMLVGEHVR